MPIEKLLPTCIPLSLLAIAAHVPGPVILIGMLLFGAAATVLEAQKPPRQPRPAKSAEKAKQEVLDMFHEMLIGSGGHQR